MPPRTARNPTSPANGTAGNAHQPLSETEVQSRVGAFVTGAETASTLSECPVCLDAFIITLLRNAPLLEYVLSKCPNFFDTALRLIVLLTHVNIPTLRVRLVANQRHCPDRMTTHTGGIGRRHTDPVYTLIDALCLLISDGLMGGPNPLCSQYATGNKKHFYKRKGVWPRALKDLFPTGLEHTLDALVFWTCVPFSDAPFRLVQKYLIVARPVVVDALLAGPRRERLAWATLQALSSKPAVPWPARSPTPFAPRAGLSIPAGLRGSGAMVDTALLLLYILWTGRDARRDDPARFFAGLEPQFRDALVLHFPNGFVEQNLITIAHYCCMLSDHAIARCTLDVADRAILAYTYVRQCTTGYRCSGPGCSRHELGGLEESEGAPERFARCANCKAIRYCNQTCQRAHWENAVPSHRDVCEVLCRLIGHGVDLAAGDSAPFVDAYNLLSPADAELLFHAAASASNMPYRRHLA